MKIYVVMLLIAIASLSFKMEAMLKYRVDHRPGFQYDFSENGYTHVHIRKQHKLSPGSRYYVFTVHTHELDHLRKGGTCKGTTGDGSTIMVYPPNEIEARGSFKDAARDAIGRYHRGIF